MNNVSLGYYIKKRRLEKGYSIEYLSEITKITTNYIHRIENGLRKNPSVPILEKIASAIEIDKVELIKFLSKRK